jgi:hypothetical protein
MDDFETAKTLMVGPIGEAMHIRYLPAARVRGDLFK